MPDVLSLSLLSSMSASEDNRESINKPPPIAESMLLQLLLGEGMEKPLPPMLLSLLPFPVSLSVSFLLLSLSSSVLSSSTLLMAESLMPLCGLTHASLASSLFNF